MGKKTKTESFGRELDRQSYMRKETLIKHNHYRTLYLCLLPLKIPKKHIHNCRCISFFGTIPSVDLLDFCLHPYAYFCSAYATGLLLDKKMAFVKNFSD